MSNRVCRFAALALLIAGMQTTAATQPAGSASTGGWGFDLAGADFTKKPEARCSTNRRLGHGDCAERLGPTTVRGTSVIKYAGSSTKEV